MKPVPPAFASLYRAQVGYVLNALRRLGVQERDLEDVAHDVFFAVYKHLSDFDPERAIRPWLFGFAYRIAADYRRLSRHRHEAPSAATDHEEENEHAAPSSQQRLPDEALDIERKRRLVLLALTRMDLERRAVLVMHDLDGHTMPDIAKELSIPLNTAYSRLRLARRDFEAAIRAVSPHEGQKEGGAPP